MTTGEQNAMKDLIDDATPVAAAVDMDESSPAESHSAGLEGAVGCAEMAEVEALQSGEKRFNRRALLGAGLLSAAGIAAGVAAPAHGLAAPATQDTPVVPAMRSPRPTPRALTSGAAPDRPSMAILALNRMAFGPRPGDIDAFNALGNDDDARLQAYVEQQLNPQSIDDSAFEAYLALWNFQTLGKSLEQLWADHLKQKDVEWSYRRLPAWETERATFLRALYSQRQLNEVLADFWHNHFNAYGWDSWQQSTWVHYDRDVIRGNMLGNFRKMVGDVAKSPAMLFYLDNQSNEGGNPNENWARELFELHTLGSENYLGVIPTTNSGGLYEHPAPKGSDGWPAAYVDDDVYGATTSFTGWRTNTDTGIFNFEASRHFPYQKIVLGRTIPSQQGIQDGEIVLDILANHRGTATFVCRKLCRRLIGDNPPESVVQAAADVFYAARQADDQLKQVVRTILLSPEFRNTWGEKIKRPFDFACSVLRATQCNYDARSDAFFWWYNGMGQSLFGWRPPDGYPDVKEAWSSTMPMLQRWRFVNTMLGWKIGGEGEDKNNLRINFDGIMPANYATPEEVVDFWSIRLLGYQLPEHERTQIVEFMAYGRGTDTDLPADQITERIRYMVGLILMSPSFQWR
ncbi:DUF1800 family protein [bacterium]|nr:DUF1800 family protein [bacterium]